MNRTDTVQITKVPLATDPKPAKVRNVTYCGVPAQVKVIKTGGANNEQEIRILWLAKSVGQPIEHEAGTVVSYTTVGKGSKERIIVHQHVIAEF